MKRILVIPTALFLFCASLTGCGGKSTEQCKDDIRAYEFGREMYSVIVLRGGGSLEKAIEVYSSDLGIGSPYNESNECVKRGYNDAENGKKSPYNNNGKSWSAF